MKKISRFKGDKKVILGLKIFICAALVFLIGKGVFINCLSDYQKTKVYDYENDFASGEKISYDLSKELSQGFVSKGNKLSYLKVYLSDISQTTHDVDLSIQIKNSKQKVIFRKVVNKSDLYANAWNTIDINNDSLKPGEKYYVVLSTDSVGSVFTVINTNVKECKILSDCSAGNGNAALGFHFVHEYLELAYVFEMVLKILFAILIVVVMSYTIISFEKMVAAYKMTEKKKGSIYALYFSLLFVQLFNPMNSIATKLTEFKRVIGAGIADGYDCTRVISNFTHWFFQFAFAISIFALLINYLRTKTYSEEQNKVWEFLDKFSIVAIVNMVLHCITYFYDQSVSKSMFYYSSFVIIIVMIAAFGYIVSGLDKKISAGHFHKIMIAAFSLSYPIAIIIPTEWENGRLLIGIQAILVLVFFYLIITLGNKLENACSKYLGSIVIILAALPMMTSIYIELVNILNQYSVFVGHPKKYYIIAVMLMLIATVCFSKVANKKNITISWKNWAYPFLILGISLLSVQVPLQSKYSADLFESANSSILISDFLNFGSIPIVEHYGGHMMTGVWEGIIYGIINHDYAGAIFSPYSNYLLLPVLAVLFYYLIKSIWDQDVALWITLLFPFYNHWSYFGLGMLICLAIIAYINKNTYFRAVLVWFAFVWCALYRLDLGSAFGIAGVVALSAYVVVYKNNKAIKQLLLTLTVVIGVFGTAWCILCVSKELNPIHKLLEFLLISKSNQNWAYSNIGNNQNTMYAWSYFFIPITVELCLLYTVFSKKFRKSISREKWIILIVMGTSYFANFSRGLVRHSLVETALTIVLWSAYIFLAIFISCFKNDMRLFIPVFSVFILCNTLFVQDTNFSDISLSDNSSSRIGSFVDTWYEGRFDSENVADGEEVKTYWEKLRCDREVVQRVVWDESLKARILPFQKVVDALLDKDDTFLDYMNRTFIYSAINRKNPVYVSQSPLQLSGEFTQEMFIEEIDKNINNIPLAILPNNSDNQNSVSIDGIPNTYRYYKVSEYIYEHYKPLCSIGEFAIWCTPDRYEEMQNKLQGKECIDAFLKEGLSFATNSCDVEVGHKSMKLSYTDPDPFLSDLQNYLNLEQYIDRNVGISMNYNSSKDGYLQMFYTTNEGEDFSQEKSVSVQIGKVGTANFSIPVTKYTKIRLDIPESSEVTISSIKLYPGATPITWGYDGATATIDKAGTESLSYYGQLHNYNLNKLPLLWAELDSNNALHNPVMSDITYDSGVYHINSSSSIDKKNGNYLRMNIKYIGTDLDGYTDEDDETIGASIRMGTYVSGKFVEKYRYNFTISEGEHDYLIRVSSDYYWYTENIDAIMLDCKSELKNVNMQILQGD